MIYFFVIPAKAGIQSQKNCRCLQPWMPAFAGMTQEGKTQVFFS
jgi:hypothetical protein